ncbi:MAG: hypothetical protein J7L11_01295 [Thermoprotei archaeon]|nr:hypothetical protein [Thermoprotei archaeon]
MKEAVAETLLSTVLGEAVKRIARKVASGKRLSDSEVMILLLDQMNKRIEERFNAIDAKFNTMEARFNAIDIRFNDLKAYIDTKFNDLKDYVDSRLMEMSKRIDDLSRLIQAMNIEVSSIKTDIIKILKEGR